MAEVVEARMSLLSHLGELRTRLIRAVLAICILAIAALAFAENILGVLMRPVLNALPPSQRALIYTSAIERINVLMKAGLYAGVVLATPVILWQIWGFIAPGLFPSERKYAGSFVLAGSIAFILGTMFAYFVILPTMFEFLVGGGDNQALQDRIKQAESREQEALRYVRIGDFADAALLAKEASEALGKSGDGQIKVAEKSPGAKASEVGDRVAALGRMVEVVHDGSSGQGPTLRAVMAQRLEALKALDEGNFNAAAIMIEDAAGKLVAGAGENSGSVIAIWAFEKQLSLGQVAYAAANWTRPMLSMDEQLSLVLVLEIGVGAIFELPLIMALLSLLGVVKAKWLMKYQRHAFIVCLVIAAIITPTGDPVNLSIMAGPMIVCYELGVLAAYLIEKRRAKNTAIMSAGR